MPKNRDEREKNGRAAELFASDVETEHALRAILNSAVDGVVTIDEFGEILAVNPAAEKLFGYAAAEIIGRNVNMLMPEPFSSEHDEYLQRYLRSGEAKIIGIGREVTGLRSDGTEFPLYLAVSEVFVGHRRLFTGFLHDLTQLRQAESRGAELGRILEESVNEIFVFDAETLRFQLVNQGALRNLGYSDQEIYDMTPVDIKPEFSREEFEELIRPLRNGSIPVLQFETRHRRRDESIYDVLVRLQLTQWRGREAFVAIILDITEGKQQQLELKIRNQAIEAANEGIVIADARVPGTPVVFVNEAFLKLTRYSREDVLGAPFESICRPAAHSDCAAELRRALQERREVQITVECERGDGTTFWNAMSVAPVTQADGSVSHFVAVIEDVTEQRTSQEQRLQSERLAAIGQMVTGLAHESRNALQRAQACVDLLALELEDQPDLLQLTGKTRRALNDLYRYYEEVRNYAAPVNLEKHRVSLRQLWRTTWKDLEASRAGCCIDLKEENVVDQELVCDVDEHRIQQVFRNILENSIAACGKSGQITVRSQVVRDAGLSEAFIELRFADTGPGFDANTASRVFQPFFTTRQKGTGLGMPIARRIVEAHGGTLSINTEVPTGAEVVMTVPLDNSASRRP